MKFLSIVSLSLSVIKREKKELRFRMGWNRTTVDSLEVTMSEAIGYFQTSYVLGHFEDLGSTVFYLRLKTV
jgi:glucose-6-phosphate 1-dehydrogenase